VQQVMPLGGGAGLRLTIARYYTPSGKMIHRDYRDKSKADEGGIFPDVEVIVKAKDEAKVFEQYLDLIYTPGQKDPVMKFTAPDPVLDKTVEILTGKLSLEEAKKASAEAAAKRKAEEKQEEENESSQETDETDEK
jgi:carboxyl-terminal processing protease